MLADKGVAEAQVHQAVQLEFGDVKGWDVYLAATTQKALRPALSPD